MACLICDSPLRNGLACSRCQNTRPKECRFLAVANVVVRQGVGELSAEDRRFWNDYRPKDYSPS